CIVSTVTFLSIGLSIAPAQEHALIQASSVSELMSALATATGGETILLKAGNYGNLSLDNVHNPFVNNYVSRIMIKSANPDDLAVFTSVQLTGVKNVTFDSVRFDYSAAAGAPDWTRPFAVDSCSGITVANSVFDGDLDYTYSTAGTGAGTGLFVSNSQNV